MKSVLTPQQAACLSLLLYGESGNSAARILRVTPAAVSRWRQKLEALGLIGAPAPQAGGRPRGRPRAAGQRSRAPGAPPDPTPVEASDDQWSPEERQWLEVGWAEFSAREWAAQEAGTDWFSRNRPDKRNAKQKPIDRLDTDGTAG